MEILNSCLCDQAFNVIMKMLKTFVVMSLCPCWIAAVCTYKQQF